MSSFVRELLEGTNAALARARRRPRPLKPADPEVDVAAIRKRLRLSQTKFASRFGLSLSTLKDWEQRRRSPDRISVNLLKVIAHDPRAVAEALRKNAPPRPDA